jgi:hypothetical protein
VRAAFGVELPLRQVFERPGLAQMAAEIDRLQAEGAPARDDAGPIRRRRRRGAATDAAS